MPSTAQIYSDAGLVQDSNNPSLWRNPSKGNVVSAIDPSGMLSSGQQLIASKIADEAQRQGVDPNFAISTANAESGLDHSAVSPKGATGVMQLMPKTAKSLGVDATNVDDNIKGGVTYQKQLLDMFGGNQQLAAAAYNAGPQAVIDHGGVPPYKETQDYVNKVTGQNPANSNDLPSADDLRSGGASSTTSTDLPSPADLRQSGQASAAQQPSQPQPQQSPGYQSALTDYQAAPKANFKTAFDPGPQVDIGSQFMNGVMLNNLPKLAGGANALKTGIANLLAKLNIGKGAGYGMNDAYTAARDLTQQGINQTSQDHLLTSGLANTAGVIVNPLARLIPMAAGRASVAALTKAGLEARAAQIAGSTLGAGTLGGTLTAGDVTNQDDPHALAHIAEGTVLSAPFGPLGELASEAGTAFAHPVAKAIAPVVAHTVLGAAGGAAFGVPGYMVTHNPTSIETPAMMGAVFGLAGKAKALKEESQKPPTVTDADRFAALSHINKVAGNGDYGVTTSQLNEAPNPTHTAAEALEPPHRDQLLQTIGAQNETNLGEVQAKVRDRQEAPVVKDRLQAGISGATGTNPEASKDVLENMQGTQQEALAKEASNLPSSVPQNIGHSVGIDPRAAESDWEGVNENRRNTVSKPLWDKVDNETPVDTQDHKHLLHEEPIVRQALGQARFALGPEAETENPNYKPPVDEKTPNNLSNDDIKEYITDHKGKEVGLSYKPEDMAQYLNDKHNPGYSDEPKTLPTQKAWILAERILRKMVPRNGFGEVDYSNPRTFEVQSTQQKVNEANKQHFKGLTEAKESSGEDAASEKANELAFDFNPKSLNGESAEKFNSRFDSMGDMQQTATKHGYLERFFQKFRENPTATAKEYLGSDQHQKVMEHMFGKDGASAINDQLNHTLEVTKQAAKGGEVASTRKIAQQAVSSKSNSIADFDRNFNDDNQEIYKHEYLNKVQEAINNLPKNGTIGEQHLNELKSIAEPSNYEHHIQDKIFGKENAEKMRQSIKKEIDAAKSSKEILEFKSKGKEEKSFFKPVESALFSMASSPHNIGGQVHGAMKGVAMSQAAEGLNLVKQNVMAGNMTPGAHRAVGEYLAKTPGELAKDLAAHESKARHVKLSKTTLKDNLAKRATVGAGAAAASGTVHAFSGLNDNR